MAGEYHGAGSDSAELALAILASLLSSLPGCELSFGRYLSRLWGPCFCGNVAPVVKAVRAWRALGGLLIAEETLATAARGEQIAFPDKE